MHPIHRAISFNSKQIWHPGGQAQLAELLLQLRVFCAQPFLMAKINNQNYNLSWRRSIIN